MSMPIKINKVTVGVILISFLLIIIPAEKWNIYMFQGLILSVFGIYNFWTLLFFLICYSGGSILVMLLFFKKKILTYHYKYIRLSIILLYIPLVRFHWDQPFSIKSYDHIFYIIPEIVFLILSVCIFLITFHSTNKNKHASLL